jgi:hypothetical protein
LLSNFALYDPIESGGAGNEMHSGFLLMTLRVWRHKNVAKKNPEAQLHARNETRVEAKLETIRQVFH